MTQRHFDIAIVGAGPAGMACAIEAKKAGLEHVLFDKGCLVNSIVRFPTHMVFFTTPELLEIGDLPLVSEHEKPTRVEGLKYYRRVAESFALNIHQYERVERIAGQDGAFTIYTNDRLGHGAEFSTRKIAIATGYYDNPNLLAIPGEALPKVSHYYTEPHPYFDQEVAVIGGKNSAIEAALDLFRNGVRVTLIYRGSEFAGSIKYWIKPDIENRIKRGEIKAHFNSQILEIRPGSIVIQNSQGREELRNDFVFALTGYRPDADFLRSLGVTMDACDLKPQMDPETHESNVAGVYLAGSIVAGLKNNEIFIENGRFHGKAIVRAIQANR